MNSIKPQILQYLTSCFRPISITASIGEWKKLNYKNRLFEVSISPNYEFHKSYPDKYKNRAQNIYFRYNTLVNTPGYFANPATLMGELITGGLQTSFDVDIYKETDDQILMTLDSKGQVPNRYIRMLHDFYFKDSKITESESDSRYWESYINQIPEHTIKKLLDMSTQVMNSNMSIKVKKSPDYYKELNNHLELFKITKTDVPSLVSFKNYLLGIDDNLLSLYFNHGISAKDNTYIFYDHIMKNRIWYTGDGGMSYPVKIFTKHCNKYTTLHKDLLNSSFYNPINELFKCEGGLGMNYLYKEPWRQLYLSTGYGTSWPEIVGSNTYSTSKNVGIEEFVVLEEILKKEGAEIEVSF